jgi:hypothetical protein
MYSEAKWFFTTLSSIIRFPHRGFVLIDSLKSG